MTEFKDTILKDIADNKITPKSRIWFLAGHVLLWVMCVLTIFFGACAIAMLLFEFYGTDRELMRLVRWKQGAGKMVAIFPYIWIILSAITLGVSAFFFRYTQRGYKHNPYLILTGIISSSILLGVILFSMRGPHVLDTFFQKHPTYKQARENIRDSILRPENGVLGGIFVDEKILRNHRGDTFQVEFQCQQAKCEQFSDNVTLHIPVIIKGELIDDDTFQAREIHKPKREDVKKIFLRDLQKGGNRSKKSDLKGRR